MERGFVGRFEGRAVSFGAAMYFMLWRGATNHMHNGPRNEKWPAETCAVTQTSVDLNLSKQRRFILSDGCSVRCSLKCGYKVGSRLEASDAAENLIV